MLAAKIRGEDSSKKLPIFKSQPLSVGIETAGGMFQPMIERNADLPIKKSMKFATYADNNSHVRIRVYEGERALCKNCEILCDFELRVPPKPRGTVQVEIFIEIDGFGKLEILARDVKSKNKLRQLVNYDKSRLTVGYINRLVNDGYANMDKDHQVRQRISAKLKLENYCS